MPFIENYLPDLCHIDQGVLLKTSKIIMPFTIFCIIWLDKKDKHKFLMKNIDLLIFLIVTKYLRLWIDIGIQ